MVYLGIDPGKSGACAAIDTSEGVLDAGKPGFAINSCTESDVSMWMRQFAGLHKTTVHAYIERVSAMPKQGVSSTFKFGQSYGFLRGLLIAYGIPFDEVSPAKWQRALGCLSGGDKRITKAKAQQLFPDVKVTHANADALLIAEYCRRVRMGE